MAGRTIAAKVMAALGATCLVGGFAIASLLQPFFTLAQLVMMVDQQVLPSLERVEPSNSAQWIWAHIAMPILLRPAWMMPTMFGVIFVGLAATLAYGEKR